MPRSRSILIDNSSASGTIHTNVTTPVNAPVGFKLAGLTPKTKVVQLKRSDEKVQVVTDKAGWTFTTRTQLSQINLTLNGTNAILKTPQGRSLIVSIRKYNANTAATSVLTTISIPSGQASNTYSYTANFIANDKIFIDVTQVGLTRAGTGLVVTYLYYQ